MDKTSHRPKPFSVRESASHAVLTDLHTYNRKCNASTDFRPERKETERFILYEESTKQMGAQ